MWDLVLGTLSEYDGLLFLSVVDTGFGIHFVKQLHNEYLLHEFTGMYTIELCIFYWFIGTCVQFPVNVH